MIAQRIENEIFSKIRDILETKYPNGGIYVVGEYQRNVSKFPCVSFTEINQVPVPQRETANNIETMVFAQYEVNVYTNSTQGKKTAANDIAKLIDDELATAYKLIRTMKQPVQNLEEATVYRIVMRYECYIDTTTNIIYTSAGY